MGVSTWLTGGLVILHIGVAFTPGAIVGQSLREDNYDQQEAPMFALNLSRMKQRIKTSYSCSQIQK
jgi:hypothetical protein